MVDITIVNGVYKPTYNWGAPSFTPLKNMKVNGKDDIPYIMENKSHVPNHQPVMGWLVPNAWNMLKPSEKNISKSRIFPHVWDPKHLQKWSKCVNISKNDNFFGSKIYHLKTSPSKLCHPKWLQWLQLQPFPLAGPPFASPPPGPCECCRSSRSDPRVAAWRRGITTLGEIFFRDFVGDSNSNLYLIRCMYVCNVM